MRTRSVSAPVTSPGGVGAVLSRVVRGPRAQRGRAGADGDDLDGDAAAAPGGRRGPRGDGDGARGRRAQPHGMGRASRPGSPPSRGARPPSNPNGRPSAAPVSTPVHRPAPCLRSWRRGRGGTWASGVSDRPGFAFRPPRTGRNSRWKIEHMFDSVRSWAPAAPVPRPRSFPHSRENALSGRATSAPRWPPGPGPPPRAGTSSCPCSPPLPRSFPAEACSGEAS